MHIGNDILDWLFPARKPLQKAAETGSTTPVVTPAQNTDYIKAAAEEAAKRQKEREAQAKKLVTPSSKKALKVLGTK